MVNAILHRLKVQPLKVQEMTKLMVSAEDVEERHSTFNIKDVAHADFLKPSLEDVITI